ncbi:MAG: helix-turn-helix domain-containing protein, partial [Coriobacteriia bacterium]|nr:helix-turn-helix domain-containing protein [Coriobacteriia bacterium]
ELRFESGESCDDEDIGISVSVENIIMESARRLELWNRIRVKIPSLDTRFIMAPAPGEKSMEIHLKPKEWMLLCFLHGSRTVRELVELTGYNDFDTAKILYGMYSAGLIERLAATDDASPTE